MIEMENIILQMKSFWNALLVGTFAALFTCLLGSFGIFIYGVTHPPLHIHLSFLSQKIFDFSSMNAATFEANMNTAGVFYLLIALTLFSSVVFSILKRQFRTSSAH